MDVIQSNNAEFVMEYYAAVDINVKPGADAVTIPCDVNMRDTKKSFPDVKELTIGSGVRDVIIPNTLFPNVKNVVSLSVNFVSNVPYLEKTNANKLITLLNTFCHNKDEGINLTDICKIADYAFKDCDSLVLINSRNPEFVEKHAFSGSAFEKQPFVKGVKMAGSIMIDIDKTAEVVDFPDDDVYINIIQPDLSDVEHVITHSLSTFTSYHTKQFPKRLTLDINQKWLSRDPIVRERLCALVHNWIPRTDYMIKNFGLSKRTEESAGLKVVDKIVYTTDMKMLVCCTEEVEHAVIPDGVQIIGSMAFSNCRLLKSVEIPDSVTKIGNAAFASCKKLEHVKIGNRVTNISDRAFMFCDSLKHITLPASVKTIGDSAFSRAGLESIDLNEGLKNIDADAFEYTNLFEIYVPKSVNKIGKNAFGSQIKKISMPKYKDYVIDSIVYHKSNPRVVQIVTICSGDRSIDIPRCVKIPACELKNRLESYFIYFDNVSVFDRAYYFEVSANMALNEYEKYETEASKDFLKGNSKDISFMLLDDDEEKFIKFLKTGMVSKVTLKKLLEETEKRDMLTAKAYVMQMLGEKNSQKEKFYI